MFSQETENIICEWILLHPDALEEAPRSLNLLS